MLKRCAHPLPQPPLAGPAAIRGTFIAPPHALVTRPTRQPLRDRICREHPGIERVADSLTTERIDHPRRIPDRNKVRRAPRVRHRPRHACGLSQIPRQRFPIHEEARIQPAAFDRDGASITVLEKPEVEDIPSGLRIVELYPELRSGRLPPEPAQFPCGIDDNARGHGVTLQLNAESVVTPLNILHGALVHARMLRHQAVQSSSRNPHPGLRKRNVHVHVPHPQTRRSHIHRTRGPHAIEHPQFVQQLHCTG